MVSVPGMELLSVGEKELFAQEFEKDRQFLELLILMISKSCATGSVDITWVDANEPGGIRQVLGTTQAAQTRCSGYVRWDRPDPSQRFCNVVNDHGRRAGETCAVCERAAEQRVGEARKSEVYRCHAGLTDIAVPVVCDGKHIATLFSGQVLTQLPSPNDFVQIRNDLGHLKHIDPEELQRAYLEVPVVSPSDLENTVRILEIFADYLARAWKRLGDTVRDTRRRLRGVQLAATEFAYLVFQANSEDRMRLTMLLQKLGFTQYPNRILIVELEKEEAYSGRLTPYDVALRKVLHAVEESAEKTKNAAVAHPREQGICIFLHETMQGRVAGVRAGVLARRILYELSLRSDIQVRIGIGGVKSEWDQLAESYHEARLALTGSREPIASFNDALTETYELGKQVAAACGWLAEQKILEARLAIRALPAEVNHQLGADATNEQRAFFSAAFESLCLAALRIGCDRESIIQVRAEAYEKLARAGNTFSIQAGFLEWTELILDEVRQLSTGKQDKIVERVRQMFDRRLKSERPETLSLAEAADALKISTGHLSRTFRRATGMTFQDYSAARRVEIGKRILLNPLADVATVSRQCGFATPAHFARVFRRKVGCSPTEYARNPHLTRTLFMNGNASLKEVD